MKVSLITVTYNDAKNLKKTLKALATQEYQDIESIIIDGGSEDETLKVIEKFEKDFHGTVKWKSEKDNGLYDALNKGIQMAKGDIIGCYWDVFASPSIVSEIVQTIIRTNADGIHGNLVYMNGNKVVRYWKMGTGSIQHGWMPGHPSLYLRREIYQKYGLYNTSYKCSGDYEFMIRCLKDKEVKLVYMSKILIKMFYGGLSTNGWNGYKRSIMESYRALKENKVRFPFAVIVLRMARTILQFTNRSGK